MYMSLLICKTDALKVFHLLENVREQVRFGPVLRPANVKFTRGKLKSRSRCKYGQILDFNSAFIALLWRSIFDLELDAETLQKILTMVYQDWDCFPRTYV